MAYIVLVLLVELVICNLAEGLAPEYERLFNRQPKDLSGLPRQLWYMSCSFTTHLEKEAIL